MSLFNKIALIFKDSLSKQINQMEHSEPTTYTLIFVYVSDHEDLPVESISIDHTIVNETNVDEYMRNSHPMLQNSPRRLEGEDILVYFDGTESQYFAQMNAAIKQVAHQQRRANRRVFPEPQVSSIFITLINLLLLDESRFDIRSIELRESENTRSNTIDKKKSKNTYST